jgi:hypothetical protein
MALKKDLMNWFAENMMKMDKEEKREFLKYVIDNMGEEFFSDMTKEEKQEVMSEAMESLIKHSGLKDKEAQKDLLVSLTETMVDTFTGGLDAGEKGEIIARMTSSTIQNLGPEIKKALGVAVRELADASPVLGDGLRRLVEDPNIRRLLRDFVKGLLFLLKDVLKSLAFEVYGYIKESGPDIQEFLRTTARKALKALLTIGIEILKKGLEMLGELMQAGGKTLLQTKDWAERAWESDELRSLKGFVDGIVDEKSKEVMKLVAQGIDDIEELAERTKMPRETIRNLLLKLWEKGEVKMDIDKAGPKAEKKGPSPSAG